MPRKTPPDRPARDLPGRRARPGLFGEGLSPDEKREAAQNLAAFFRLLDAWDRAGLATMPAATTPTAAAKAASQFNNKVAAKVNDRVAAKVAGRGSRPRGRTR